MITEDLNNIDINNIYMLSSIKNNLIVNGTFNKLIYSNDLYISNGIYINIIIKNITNHSINSKHNNCYIEFDVNKNEDIIKKLYDIENNILINMINVMDLDDVNNLNDNKICCYKINELFKSGVIKLNNNNHDNYNENYYNHIILKLSGIWQNNNSIGISYRIIPVNRSIKF